MWRKALSSVGSHMASTIKLSFRTNLSVWCSFVQTETFFHTFTQKGAQVLFNHRQSRLQRIQRNKVPTKQTIIVRQQRGQPPRPQIPKSGRRLECLGWMMCVLMCGLHGHSKKCKCKWSTTGSKALDAQFNIYALNRFVDELCFWCQWPVVHLLHHCTTMRPWCLSRAIRCNLLIICTMLTVPKGGRWSVCIICIICRGRSVKTKIWAVAHIPTYAISILFSCGMGNQCDRNDPARACRKCRGGSCSIHHNPDLFSQSRRYSKSKKFAVLFWNHAFGLETDCYSSWMLLDVLSIDSFEELKRCVSLNDWIFISVACFMFPSISGLPCDCDSEFVCTMSRFQREGSLSHGCARFEEPVMPSNGGLALQKLLKIVQIASLLGWSWWTRWKWLEGWKRGLLIQRSIGSLRTTGGNSFSDSPGQWWLGDAFRDAKGHRHAGYCDILHLKANDVYKRLFFF